MHESKRTPKDAFTRSGVRLAAEVYSTSWEYASLEMT